MFWIGTSGYDYPEWRGSFYPEKFPASRMLGYYAARFPTVEINYTFYHLPAERTLASWAEQTPEGFRFTLKAPRRITHVARLRDCAPLVATFCDLAGGLGGKLGALLFQLPPFLRKDVPLLEDFLAALPPGARAAVEFRHASWFDDEVFAALRARRAALCVADSERMSTPVVTTAPFGYFRLRDEGYTGASLESWARTIRAESEPTGDTFVYFKHEEAGKGPEFARLLREHLEGRMARAEG
jgi:uncharacterized protein YecE (DUF72 family)